MIIKESEALSKQCPVLNTACMGKECMWWEWAKEWEKQRINTIKPPVFKGYSETYGYCWWGRRCVKRNS